MNVSELSTPELLILDRALGLAYSNSVEDPANWTGTEVGQLYDLQDQVQDELFNRRNG